MKQATVVIKKYGNRRLYDTSSSRYVNLEDVAALVRSGADVQVLDAKTGEDLTRVVLTQIITEDAKGQPSGLPLELLRQLVMASDYARQEFLAWYLRNAFEAYHKIHDSVQGRLVEMSSAALAPLQKMRTLLAGAISPEPEPDSELELLRRRIAELEAELKAREPEKPRAPKRKPSARKARSA